MEKVKSIILTKWFWIGSAVALILAFVLMFNAAYASGQESSTAKVNEEALNYNQLLAEVEKQQKELEAVNSDIESAKENLQVINDDLDKNQSRFDRLKDLASNETKIKSEITAAETTLDGLKSNIDEAKDTLGGLEGKIVKAKGKPTEVGAGHFVFGSDIKPGRYEVTPVGRGTNFVVYSSSGSLAVNTILGSNGVPSYVFEAGDGYTLENEGRVKLTPVE